MSTPTTNLSIPAPPISKEDIAAAVRDAVSSSGSNNNDGKLQSLLTDNFQYREAIRNLNVELATLRSRVPAEGALVLTGDDLKIYNEFIALKLKPAEVTALQSKATELEKSAAAFKLKEAIAAAAVAENYDATVLGTLVNGQDLTIKPVDETVDGKPVKVDRAFINIKGADGVVTERRLSEFMIEKHSTFLPVLTVAEGIEGERSSTSNGGTQYIPQRGTATKATGNQPNPAKAYLSRKYGPKPQAEQGKA